MIIDTARHPSLEPVQIEQARTLYAAGELSIKEIMKLTGIKSYDTFYKYVVVSAASHRAGRPKKITQAQIEQAKSLYAAGELSVKEIMKITEFKCYLTFHKYVVEAAIHHRAGRPRKVTQPQIEQAKSLYAAGELSIKEIMKIVGFKSHNTFYKYVTKGESDIYL
jgi:AraC-like DNA-binding protein